MQNTQERSGIVLIGHPALDDPTPRIEVIEYTPELCQLILDRRNLRNRKLARGWAERYASDMEAGEWFPGTDGYGFYGLDGAIQNGQKRLLAQVIADFTCVVTTHLGLGEKSREGQDLGQRRGLADLLTMDGLPNDRAYGAALRLILVMRRVWKGEMVSFKDARNQPNIHDSLALAMDPNFREEIAESYAIGKMMQKAEARLSRAMATALHYLATQEFDYETATSFFEQVMNGVMLPKEGSIYRLRTALLRNALSTGPTDVEGICALVIKAFNWHVYGVAMDQLSWRKGGEKGEKFPRFGQKPSDTKLKRLQAAVAVAPGGKEE